jgi:hypothetical protein
LRLGSGTQNAENVLPAGNTVGISAQRTCDRVGEEATLV